MIETIYQPAELDTLARNLFRHERSLNRLDGWFIVKECCERVMEERTDLPHVIRTATALKEALTKLPIYLDENAVFAGTERDAFARSYALINPNFSVSTFNGYCDPTAVFDDITSNEAFPQERIDKVREQTRRGEYVSRLTAAYDAAKTDTEEVAYFIEQVTGHLIPDLRPALKYGVRYLMEQIDEKLPEAGEKREQYLAMKLSLEGVLILAKRYAVCAQEMSAASEGRRKEQFAYLASVLRKVP